MPAKRPWTTPLSFGYVRETSVAFGIALCDKDSVADQSDRWAQVGEYVTDAVGRTGKSPEQLEAEQPRGDRIGAKTIRKLMRGEPADYRRGNVTHLAAIMGVRNDWLERLLRNELPIELHDGEPSPQLERRLATIEAQLRTLNDHVFGNPTGGDVVPFRPRPAPAPPPDQPLPSAARETKGRKRPPRSGTVNRPTGVEPEPEAP